MRQFVSILALAACQLFAAAPPARSVDPTFLRRNIFDVQARPADISTETCRYKPLFGEGDTQPGIVRGVARFGEITVAPAGTCRDIAYPAEEQAYVVMEGQAVLHYATETAALKEHDFLYLPATVKHALSNSSSAPVRVFVMGFHVPSKTALPLPKLTIANIDDIAKQNVSGHPDSVVYQLMMGDTLSKRDRIAAGHVLVSLYMMEFQPGGTNFPHHHDAEEEIYVLLDGAGQMVAGSGMDGVEGRFPAKPGDAYFFRLNCTVGFYNGGRAPAHILAVRSTYPRRDNTR